jgi:hypothetical protein
MKSNNYKSSKLLHHDLTVWFDLPREFNAINNKKDHEIFVNERHFGRKSGFPVQIIKFDFSIANFLLQGNPTNVAKKTPFE